MTVMLCDWSMEELGTLRRMFAADCDDHAIADRLGRTVSAVASRRCKLGLRRHVVRTNVGNERRARAWDDRETSMLRAALEMGWTDEHIGQLLNRSANSIKGKRETLRNQGETHPTATPDGLTAPFPAVTDKERARGEAMLTAILGGHKGQDLRPIKPYQPPAMPYTMQPEGSSISWCAL